MACYEYQCTACGVVTEHICPISERPDSVKCPRCGSPAEQVILSAPGVLTGGMSQAPLDVVIGRDAEKRWDRIHQRQEVRDKIRQDSGKSGLTATGRDTYEAHDKPLVAVKTPEPSED